MSTTRRPWPVNRTTACLIAAALIGGTLAAKVPALRGGLFLLAGMACAIGWVIHAARQPR